MKTKDILLLFIALSLFSSCMREIDLEELRPDPKLVLNCLIQPGDSIRASLSRTWFYTERYPNLTIQYAKMDLYVNGELKERMTYQPHMSEYNSAGFYSAEYIPQVGDRIRITAEKEGYEAVAAESELLAPVPILDLKVTQVEDSSDRYYSGYNRITLTFEDSPNQKNYYLVRFEIGTPIYEYGEEFAEYSGEYVWNYWSVDYSTDQLFSSHLSALETIMGYDWLSGYYGRVFNDDLIDGKRYTINLKSYSNYYTGPIDPEAPEQPPYLCRANLYAITPAYYHYMMSLLAIEDDTMQEAMADAGLAEPTRVYSNIEGGVGIFGGCSSSTVEVEMLPFN